MLNKLLKSRSANAYKMLQQILFDANLLLTARLTCRQAICTCFAVCVSEGVCVCVLQNVLLKYSLNA